MPSPLDDCYPVIFMFYNTKIEPFSESASEIGRKSMFYNIFLDIHQKGGLHNKDFDRNIRRFGRGWTSCHMFIEFSIYNMVYIYIGASYGKDSSPSYAAFVAGANQYVRRYELLFLTPTLNRILPCSSSTW